SIGGLRHALREVRHHPGGRRRRRRRIHHSSEGGSMSESLKQLSRHGVSIWLDDLSRTRLESGDLARLIDESSVTGVTTNPTIFANAISAGSDYDSAVAELGRQGSDVDSAIEALTTTDVAEAARLFRPAYDATDGDDGRVSIEVAPPLAHDAAGTVESAKALWERVDEPNAMIKIPATEAGLRAIADTIAAGISVNVTLVFSLTRYRHVVEAFSRAWRRRARPDTT